MNLYGVFGGKVRFGIRLTLISGFQTMSVRSSSVYVDEIYTKHVVWFPPVLHATVLLKGYKIFPFPLPA